MPFATDYDAVLLMLPRHDIIKRLFYEMPRMRRDALPYYDHARALRPLMPLRQHGAAPRALHAR